MCINKNKEMLPFYEIARDIFRYDNGRLISIDNGKEVGTTNRGYRVVSIKGRQLKAHRVIWYIVNGYLPNIVDHIDGNGLNNKIDNLRDCKPFENVRNSKKNSRNTSGVVGVCKRKDGSYRVGIQIRRGVRKEYSGIKDFELACFIRQNAEEKYYGEYRSLR